ncbi:MAG TPA: DMT family transporter [Candidatus Binatia bacterium]|nr:DMT family transporter [Candidatus Binatia bacterium]
MSEAPPGSAAGRGSAGLLGAGLILLAATCFGTLGPIAHAADEAGVSSLALVTWRAALGAACMLLLIALRVAAGQSPVSRLRELPARDRWFVASAAVANAALNLAMFIAFLRIGIALALLVFYTYPAWVALASTLWFGERLDRPRWAALGLALLGMVLVVAGAGQLGGLDSLGIVLAFGAGLAQAFYVMAARHGFARVPVVQAAGLTMGGAAAIYVVIALLIGQLPTLAQPLASAAALWPVLVAGVVGAGLATYCFITGIRLLGAPRAAILSTFEPVVGVVLAAVLLAEQPTPLQLVGGALIIVAGIVLQLRPRAELAEHEAVGG